MYMSGVGTGMTEIITATVRQAIRMVRLQGSTVSIVVVAGLRTALIYTPTSRIAVRGFRIRGTLAAVFGSVAVDRDSSSGWPVRPCCEAGIIKVGV